MLKFSSIFLWIVGSVFVSTATYLTSNLTDTRAKSIALGHILQKQVLEPSLLHLGYVPMTKYEQVIKERDHFEEEWFNVYMESNDAVPENALLGKCYARCLIQDEYETITRQVLLKKGYVGNNLTYIDVPERILRVPASTRWIKGEATKNCLSASPSDCQVWCLKEIPAQYDTIIKQAVVLPHHIHPSKLKRATELDEYGTMSTKRLVKEGSFTDWVEVLCSPVEE